jgi:hypothetical protein
LSGNAEQKYFEYFLDEETVSSLLQNGYAIDVLHDDIVTFLEQNYGGLRMTFGEYYTFAEMEQELDQIVAAYPNQAMKVSIGTSWEDRDVWALKVSDNVTQREPEHRVLVSAVHHAREPIGCSVCLDFAKHLLENYGTDDTATTIVNNDEVWIVPVVNPDGYVFNETYEDPWGDGWRKNCRDNNNNGQMDTDYDGVDLNRNYGYMWGYDNSGSSPNPPDETYRGPSAFSEPETQAIRTRCNVDSFIYNIDYHSYGDYLIYPWGYIDALPPDSDLYQAMADTMTSIIGVPNNYVYGNCYQTVGYPANGGTFDWMYGDDSEKPSFIAFSVEVGSSFWQGASDTNVIIQQCNETRPMNIYLCYKAALVGIEENRSLTFASFSLRPNPAQNAVRIAFQLERPMKLDLKIHDAAGRIAYQKTAATYLPGKNEITIDGGLLAAGVYFVDLSQGNERFLSEKLVLIK